jgi:pimeloyl-ACP methyl ester carboxylesterase
MPAVVLMACGLAACGGSGTPVQERLQPCASADGPTDAWCGTLEVIEDRVSGRGRRIALSIVVLPAVGPRVQDDPLIFLAGGPGQGAARMARQVRDLFRRVQRDRDIVLIDQRGTGRSHPLDCDTPADSLRDLLESEAAALERLRVCLDGYDADVRFYTTSHAMDDVDEVRAWLGYDRVNLYGGSYGTRAALEYLRRHGSRVRTVILDGVAPADMRLPLFMARDAQRALDRLLADCEADAACRNRYPGLAARIGDLLDRLARSPAHVRVVHPRTGVAEDVVIEARVIAGILFSALYAPQTAALVPLLVDRASDDDFQGLLALALAGEAVADNMSRGMQLSVICSEDAPRGNADARLREAARSVFGTHLLPGLAEACAIWPAGDVDPGFYDPVVSDVPVLILSGDLDPVTPPSWGDAIAGHLTNTRHVVVAGTGHGVVGIACGAQLVQDVLARGSVEGLDSGCATRVRRPPFFLTPSGPDPLGLPGRREP